MAKMPAFLKSKAPKVPGGMSARGAMPTGGAAPPKGMAPPFGAKGAKMPKLGKMKK